jgi:hypothetical protein
MKAEKRILYKYAHHGDLKVGFVDKKHLFVSCSRRTHLHPPQVRCRDDVKDVLRPDPYLRYIILRSVHGWAGEHLQVGLETLRSLGSFSQGDAQCGL